MKSGNGEDAGFSRAEDAYRKLRNAIATGTLRPGSRVREAEIAASFNISRTPVREAIRRLQSEGLIVHVAHHGAVVAVLDHQAVIELYDMREVLEGTAAGLAARHASEAEIEELRDLITDEVEAAGDAPQLARLNRMFHGALYRAAHNRYLLKALLSLNDAMTLLGGTTLGLPGRDETARGEHAAVIDAIANRDGNAAEAAARKHIRSAQRARLKLMRRSLLDDEEGFRGPG